MVLLIAALFVLLAALFLLWRGSARQRESGLPAGRVLYADPKPMGAPEKPLFDTETGLTGKPDYLVTENGKTIPVEVKSGWAPPEPHEGHVYQLMAYCLLVEQTTGVRPPYGIIRYRNRSFTVEYTREAEHQLRLLLEEMQEQGRKKEQARSHQIPARCARCGYRSTCEQRLD